MNGDFWKLKIAIVGGGHMGQALLAGWIENNAGVASQLVPGNFQVVNPGEEKRAAIQERFNVACVADVRELEPCDVVILCVKPQIMDQVLADMQGLGFVEDALFLTPAAGVSTERIAAQLPGQVRVVRFMPNMPLAVQRGVLPVCLGAHATEQDRELADGLFACLGNVHWIREEQMDAATAVSGSGPGYVAQMLAAMAEAGVREGLDAHTAEALARDTMEGTAAYMRLLGKGALETRDAIATPGGTTSAGLDALDAAGFAQAVHAGIAAAAARSRELAQGSAAN